MTPEFVVGFARQAIEMTLIISLPMLGIGMAVGIFVSVLQAATQIQEMTLTMVPKIVAIFVALIIAFPWIMDKMMSYTTNLFLNLPNYIKQRPRLFPDEKSTACHRCKKDKGGLAGPPFFPARHNH
eukprot:TRINITY_DN13040_c0_g4_i1.p3 TRINITY_DN13040_c0_g4~~TRINITY_DN13040_c0_g4_i1.p3  ORF type:complete len:126 (-),score=30.24 TRINITY_DN13040_c0_g4_i1:244-621(-)